MEIASYMRYLKYRFVPQVWGVVPLGYVISPPIPNQAQGIGGWAYH